MPSCTALLVLVLALSSACAGGQKASCKPRGMTTQSNKSVWPECVGAKVDDAEALIKQEAPDATVIRVPDGSMVTADYRLDRVRIYYKDNVVRDPPRRG
ncbi:maize proteinase inhibitor [Haematococcus lacustris]